MSTEFARTSKRLEEIEAGLERGEAVLGELRGGLRLSVEALMRRAGIAPQQQEEQQQQQQQELVQGGAVEGEKFVAMYGPAMIAKVKSLVERFQKVLSKAEELEKERPPRAGEVEEVKGLVAPQQQVVVAAREGAVTKKVTMVIAVVNEEEERKRKERIWESAKEVVASAREKDPAALEQGRLNQALIQNPDLAISEVVAQPNYKQCLKALIGILTNIVKNPENEAFRRIRLGNASFERDLKNFRGACEILVSTGFRVQASGDENGDESAAVEIVEYFNQEPEISDFDNWSNWHKRIQETRDKIQLYL